MITRINTIHFFVLHFHFRNSKLSRTMTYVINKHDEMWSYQFNVGLHYVIASNILVMLPWLLIISEVENRNQPTTLHIFDWKPTKALKGRRDFQKKPEVNRYNELCNPFSRISNSFPRIGQLVLSNWNSFFRIR